MILAAYAQADDRDLTPGLEARIACPEAIWAAALHWEKFYSERHDGRVPMGRYSAKHTYPIFDQDDPGPTGPGA